VYVGQADNGFTEASMRIGFFADMYLPHVSGVTHHVSAYKAQFERRGHEVFVVTFGDLDYADAEDNVVRSAALPWGSTGWQLSAGLSARAREIIPTLDIAHVHHPFQSGRFVLPLAQQAGVPLVFTNHTRYDLYSDTYAGFVPHTARYAFVRRSLGQFVRACDLVIAPSASIATWLDEFVGFEDAEVIPNGIDVAAFQHPAATVTREELGFGEDDVVFCYAGRLGAEKRIRELIAEFAAVARTLPSARLLLLGGGPERAAAEAEAQAAGIGGRVHFAGMVPYGLIPGYEQLADVFVTASVSEAHPLVVIEALAAGLPVIAIASPGIGDTVEHGKSGLLAHTEAPGALAQLMERVGADGQLRAHLSAGAAVRSQAFAIEETADQVLRAYEGVLDRALART
jgi:glycosyltransferase involved in cell wall biosynthesis